MRFDRAHRWFLYASSAMCGIACLVFLSLWGRSYWRIDSIRWRYAEAGQFELSSKAGTFAVGHQDGRFNDFQEPWAWYSSARGNSGKSRSVASIAGFGWSSRGISDREELHVRYWVAVAGTALLAAVPWMQWRYSVRALLIASTVLALMIGISAASYRREMALKNSQRSKVEVVYDFGNFRADVRPLFVDSLERGTDFQVISLHPMSYKATPENGFHGWMELGRTTVADASARERLIAAFRGGVNAEREDDDCFEPRHAIRVKFEGQTIDFVICFDCGGVVAYVDSKRKIGFTVGETPQPEFDKILSAAGVQLAPTAYD